MHDHIARFADAPRGGVSGGGDGSRGAPFYAGCVLIFAGPLLDAAALPEFGMKRVITEWGIDPYLFVGTVWVAGLYLLGVWTLHSRGDRWPVGRTWAFVVGGVGSFYVATQSGLATYDDTLLSAHMVQHMILSMVVPVFLALGAPVTLALRTLPRRPRGCCRRARMRRATCRFDARPCPPPRSASPRTRTTRLRPAAS